MQIRRAIGEVNEVRDVLRRCISGQIQFDDVELLHTDTATYVPLVYESLSVLAREGEALGDDLPVTFAEGIPCLYSRQHDMLDRLATLRTQHGNTPPTPEQLTPLLPDVWAQAHPDKVRDYRQHEQESRAKAKRARRQKRRALAQATQRLNG